jgi:hypothetical protein
MVRWLRRRLGVMWRAVQSRRRLIGVVVVGCLASVVMLAAASVLVLQGPVEWWLGGRVLLNRLDAKDRVTAVNAARQIAVATAVGTAAGIGLWFAARTYYLSRRGQLTDRYSRAIAQISSDKRTERLGGIYALEHLMDESPRDHNTVVEVLAAFVRERAPAAPLKPSSAEGDDPATAVQAEPERQTRPARDLDVQAALTVLGRRPSRIESHRLNLAVTDLRDADLTKARLQGADLTGAQLRDANLRRAQLQGADMSWARMQDAHLNGAQLQNADLYHAHLQGAHLADAQLQDAGLTGAQLQKADLSGTQLQGAELLGAQLQGTILRGARGLTVDQLRDARIDDLTILDSSLRRQLGRPRRPPPTRQPPSEPAGTD